MKTFNTLLVVETNGCFASVNLHFRNALEQRGIVDYLV